ncbi:MAG: hypothetical protein PWQ23_1236 [Thermoanaerobacter sp.]|jgi:hypothetical protein|nr:MAG: hypothetical protein XD37_2005 [Thermoanaerobacter thermocopriae]MDI3529417.1 hypothetical protein [Thermoanaerobacter sp.]
MRIQIVFREKADKDIIDWYNSLPEGDRANQIRLILKKHIQEENEKKKG